MVPSEYRLEQVAARLTERLEATRRSHPEPEAAAAVFGRVADQVTENAIAEFEADGFVDHPEQQAALLREEIRGTFLPRYTRLATAMTAREDGGFGLGFLHGPVGRLVIAAASLLLIFFFLRIPGPWAVKVAPIPILLLTVFIPDLVAWVWRRRYKNQVVELLEDLGRVQDRASDYSSGREVDADDPWPLPGKGLPAEDLLDEVDEHRRAARARRSDPADDGRSG
jgi:hypothetical protein